MILENPESDTPVPRCGFIALAGRPNTGKSTLLNCLVDHRISITSRKPQTTRHAIQGIDTAGHCQAIYVDTPGLHADEPRVMNRMLNRSARDALSGVDLVLHILEAGVWRAGDEFALGIAKQAGVPCFAVLNKVDLLKKKESLLPLIAGLAERDVYAEIIPISAKRDQNIDRLRAAVHAALPEGPFLFPEDQVTDRSERFLVAEMIREQLVRRYGDELPYQSAVAIDSWRDEPELLHIHATIFVERDSQKKIVLGHGGLQLRDSGIEARKRLESFLGRPVNLRLWVKVKGAWSDDARLLHSLGYGDPES